MTISTSPVATLAQELRDEVRQHLRSGRVILAVDGVPGAGQAAFADALAAAFAEEGTAVVRASAGAFRAPATSGAPTASGAPAASKINAPDPAVIRHTLIEPFRSSASAGFAVAPGADAVTAPKDAVLIVEGAFLLGPELRGLWNWSVWLEVHPTSAFARLAAQGGSDPDPEAPSNEAVRAAVRAYRRTVDPRSVAAALVENTDAAAPVRIFGDFC